MERDPGRQQQTGLLTFSDKGTTVPESPGELAVLVFRVKRERVPSIFFKKHFRGAPYPLVSPGKQSCLDWVGGCVTTDKNTPWSSGAVRSLQVDSGPFFQGAAKGKFEISLPKTQCDATSLCLQRLLHEKATPTLLHEKEWKSARYQMTAPMLLASLATNSLADDMSTEEEEGKNDQGLVR